MAKTTFRALVVSRDAALRDRIRGIFPQDNVRIDWYEDTGRISGVVRRVQYDLAFLSDASAGSDDPYNADMVRCIAESNPLTQVLLVVDKGNIPEIAPSLTSGAYHYIKRPASDSELEAIIKTALRDRPSFKLQSRKAHKRDRLDGLIGRSLPMQKVFELILRAAQVEVPVLILGETGTGKDVAAQIIHRRSQRKKKPYMAINLGSLPTELVASEIFGHEKGAFSGATARHHGVFERTADGTVFLDEIDCIDEKVAVSLLRLLEQKSFHRLGGTAVIKSDARLIAASNADMDELVKHGKYRSDLFYRLDVFRIVMPSLSERSEDIPLLVNEFTHEYTAALNPSIKGVSDEFMGIMQSYDWPGNVREMKNVIQRAVLMCTSDKLGVKDLPPRFTHVQPSSAKIAFEIGTPLDQIERTMVIRALEATGNNRKEAAKLLGISRRVIYNKLKKHGIS